MLTVKNLQKILLELFSLKEIGCTYDFKERFEVGLTSLEVLGLAKIIRTKIPTCGDHCERYNDCKWIPIFQKRKSKSKYKLTKDASSLIDTISSESISDSGVQMEISSYLISTPIVDQINSMLIGKTSLSIEQLVSALLKETNLSLQAIRTTMKDILDLLVSAQIIRIKEGIIVKYV
ncbi:MAG: hypothetical protein KGD59_13520 [Candidatus Heimdallarchaeota archaeon]|nr:hypothetical protein [Candidatus Heimdallarchaeota archaeon]MBY8995564.1 hypothetical protein [Candidatus Heimdallarchaeota archaeon]